MKVLVVGMRGVGIETAKNLALQGAGAITVEFFLCTYIWTDVCIHMYI